MSPRTQEANEAIRVDRRAAILNTALFVFVESGFEGTRIQDIADRCGLSYGLVYRYFPSKVAVFSALVDIALEAAGSLIRTQALGSSPHDLGIFGAYAVSDPSPLYFAILVEALTKKGVPSELAAKARTAVQGLKAAIAAVGVLASLDDVASWSESVLAVMLGASILKICGVSDGRFAARAVSRLSTPSAEKKHGKV